MSFSFVLYRNFRISHQADFDATLYNYAVDLAQAIDIGSFGDVELRGQILKEKIFPFPLGRAFLQISTMDGEIIARSITLGNSELPITSEQINLLREGQTVYRLVEFNTPPDLKSNTTFRQIDYVIHRPPIPNLVLQIAVPTTLFDRQMSSLFNFFATWIPIILLFSALGGFYVAGMALRPVREIIEKAGVISATDLNVRVPVPTSRDELRQLALTLNGLLARLQKAFESQDQFVANASHQLRTPLAILKGELDILMSKSRSVGETQEFLESARQELGHLSKIVSDLLLIAKMNAGGFQIIMQTISLDEVVLNAVARLEGLAHRKNVKLRFSFVPEDTNTNEFEILGDPDLLQSLFFNLIENAIKWSPNGGMVTIEIGKNLTPFVIISDEGPGIPNHEMESVFSRFERGTENSQVPGVGLGLAIARQIAELHQATLKFQSTQKGASLLFLAKAR